MKEKRAILILSAALLCAMVAMLLALGLPTEQPSAAYVPPEFDPAAQTGTPELPPDVQWTEIYQEGMSFRACLNPELTVQNGRAAVYFSSDAENTVWLRLRVLDTQGNTLGQTGLLRPGEYVSEVVFSVIPADGVEIRLKLMSYEPETYYSAGTVSINTTVRVGKE